MRVCSRGWRGARDRPGFAARREPKRFAEGRRRRAGVWEASRSRAALRWKEMIDRLAVGVGARVDGARVFTCRSGSTMRPGTSARSLAAPKREAPALLQFGLTSRDGPRRRLVARSGSARCGARSAEQMPLFGPARQCESDADGGAVARTVGVGRARSGGARRREGSGRPSFRGYVGESSRPPPPHVDPAELTLRRSVWPRARCGPRRMAEVRFDDEGRRLLVIGEGRSAAGVVGARTVRRGRMVDGRASASRWISYEMGWRAGW